MHNHPVLSLAFLIALSASSLKVNAQRSELRFDHLTTSDGLSEGVVYCILQDSKGYLWFGTHEGLNRYDGYSFTVFKNNPYDTLSLCSNQVTALFEDGKGTLWIGTQGGLDRFDRHTESFQHFRHDANNSTSLLNDGVEAFCEDRSGNLWIGTGFGINIIDAGMPDSASSRSVVFRHLPLEINTPQYSPRIIVRKLLCDSAGTVWIGTREALYSLRSGDSAVTPVLQAQHEVLALCEQPPGVLWIGTFDGLLRYEVTTGKRITYSEVTSKEQHDKAVRSIVTGSDGNLWIASHGGLYTKNTRTDSFQYFRNDLRDSRTLSNDRIYSLYEDKSGVLWIGTFGSGIDRTNLIRKRFSLYRRDDTGINSQRQNMVMSILEDHLGKIWVGSWENGLAELDRQSTTWTRFTSRHPEINCMTEDAGGNIWIGTSGELAELARNNQRMIVKYPSPVSSIFLDHNSLWFGFAGELRKLDLATNQLSSFIVDSTSNASTGSMVIDNTGIVWIADRGLRKFDPRTGYSKTFRHDPHILQSISSDAVNCISEGTSGELWIGTVQGLNRFDREHETFVHYTEQDGLPNNVIYGILEDESGCLWMSTNKGISRFNPKTRVFRNFDIDDGLQGNEFNRGAFSRSKSGEMFFGGTNGFNSFFPKEILDNAHIPPVVLTEFQVFNQRRQFAQAISDIREITLPHNENFFSFEFAALDFANQKKNKYTYTLKGVDKDWIAAGTRRLASYTDVHPGKYLFRVKGSNNDDVWNEAGLTIAVTIVPPYWATWWFRTIAALFFLSIGLVIYYRRVNALKREKTVQEQFSRQLIESQEGERKRIAAALHDSLGQNLIISKNHAMIGLKESKEPSSIEHLTEISSLLSQSLDEVREIAYNLRPYHLDRIGLTRTLEFIIDRVKSSTAMQCTTEFENIDHLLTPEGEISLYRVIQESLNNIVKHSGATEMRFSIRRDDHQLHVSVQDNGKGFDKLATAKRTDDNKGFGMNGMAERIRLLNGTMEIMSQPHQGTTLTFTIPYTST